jgi:SAM-dependent methyltransferase
MLRTFYEVEHRLVSIIEWAVIERHLHAYPKNQPLRILDLGCGVGRYLLPLVSLLEHHDLKGEIIGVDIVEGVKQRIFDKLVASSPKEINISDRGWQIGATEVYVVTCAEAEIAKCIATLSETTGFDLIINTLSFLSHITSPEKREKLLKSLAKSLGYNGRYLGTFPNVENAFQAAIKKYSALRNSWKMALTNNSADSEAFIILNEELGMAVLEGDCYIQPFRRYSNLSIHNVELFCHAFSATELMQTFSNAGFSIEPITAAKCMPGYAYLGSSLEAIDANLRNANLCLSLDEGLIASQSYDFLVIGSSKGSRRYLGAPLFDSMLRPFFKSALSTILWQRGFWNGNDRSLGYDFGT